MGTAEIGLAGERIEFFERDFALRHVPLLQLSCPSRVAVGLEPIKRKTQPRAKTWAKATRKVQKQLQQQTAITLQPPGVEQIFVLQVKVITIVCPVNCANRNT